MTASDQTRARIVAERILGDLLREMRDGTSGEQARVLVLAVQRGYEQGRIDESQRCRGAL